MTRLYFYSVTRQRAGYPPHTLWFHKRSKAARLFLEMCKENRDVVCLHEHTARFDEEHNLAGVILHALNTKTPGPGITTLLGYFDPLGEAPSEWRPSSGMRTYFQHRKDKKK